MSFTLADAIVYLRGDDTELRQTFNQGQSMTNQFVNQTGSRLGGLGGPLGIAGGAFKMLGGAVTYAVGGLIQQGINSFAGSVGGLAQGMIGGNAQFEQYNTQFGVLLGSAEAAKERMADLAEFGATTPFELPQVVEADKILQGFGLHSEEAAAKFGFSGEQIRTIAGDVASGTGSSFQEMSLLIGKFSAGATGEAIARMQELGITTRDELSQMGLEFSESGQLLSPLPEAMNVVLSVMEEKYGGLMDAQSSTFNGMLSNLSDWKGATLRTIGEPIFEVLREKLAGLLAFLGSSQVQTFITNFATGISNGIGTAIDYITGTVIPNLQQFADWFTNTGIPAAELLGKAISAIFTGADLDTLIGDAVGLLTGGFGPGSQADQVVTFLNEAFGSLQVTWASVVTFITGTLVPAFQQFGDWFVSVGWPAIQAFAAQALPQLIIGLQTLGQWATQIGQAILPLLAQAWEWVTNNMNIVMPILAVIGAVILALNAPIAAIAGAILLLATAWGNNWGNIQGITQQVTDTIRNIIQTVLGAIQGFWNDHGAQIISTVQNAFTTVQGIVQTVTDFIRNLIQTVLATIQSFWTQHGDAIKQLIENTFLFIRSSIDNALQFITGIIQAFKAAREGDWTAFGEHLRSSWDALWAQIGNILTTAKNNLTTIISEAVETILGWIDDLKARGEAKAGEFVSGIRNAITGIDWGELGLNIANGVASGLANGASAIVDAAIAAAQAALDAAKGFLGIESPSKVAGEEIGAPITAGIAKYMRNITPIKDSMGFIAGQITSLAQDMIPFGTQHQKHGALIPRPGYEGAQTFSSAAPVIYGGVHQYFQELPAGSVLESLGELTVVTI